MTTDTQQKILDAVDAGFDAQLATTRDFVAIPSTRGAEGPCQDMIGDLCASAAMRSTTGISTSRI
jgi:acetylornithine deacetylase